MTPTMPERTEEAREEAVTHLYRFLDLGEIIEAGDECPSDNCERWEPVNRWAIGSPRSAIFKIIRRRVSAPAAGGVGAVGEAIEPFRRLLSTIEALWAADRFTDDAPVYKMLPSPWITVGDLRKLVASLFPAPTGGSEAGGELTDQQIKDVWKASMLSASGGEFIPAFRAVIAADRALRATPAPSPAVGVREALTDEWFDKARELYERCKSWPEKSTDGMMALLELRNHVFAALSPATAAREG